MGTAVEKEAQHFDKPGVLKLLERVNAELKSTQRSIAWARAIMAAPLYQDPHVMVEALERFFNAMDQPMPSCPQCGCPVLPDKRPNESCDGCGRRLA